MEIEDLFKEEAIIVEKAKELREAKDNKFKNAIKLLGFEEGNISKNSYYNADKILKKEKTIVIMESSSTGDRKVHIGELTQFLSFCSQDEEYSEYYWVLFLCGKSKYAPKAEDEIKRLQYYYDSFPLSGRQKKKIKKIAVVEQPDDQELSKLKINDIYGYEGLVL